MKILIIGASGYIGSHVAAAFADAGHEVSALHRPGGAPLPARYGHVTGNLAEPGALTAAAASYDRVIHAGAPIDDGTDRAGAEALLTSGSPLLYTTGAAVLGTGTQDEDSPTAPHLIAAGRPAIERRVLRAGGWVIRPGMVYGDGGGLVHGLLTTKAAERGTGVYIGPPGTRWPVVHIDDLAALYLAVATRAAPGTIWHGASETVRLDAIANRTRPRPSRELAGVRGPRRTRPAGRPVHPRPGRLSRKDPRRAGLGTRQHLHRHVPHRLTTAPSRRIGRKRRSCRAERQGTRPGSCTRACAGLRLS